MNALATSVDPKTGEPLFGVREAAKALGLTPLTVYRQVHLKRLRPRQLGRVLLFPRMELERYRAEVQKKMAPTSPGRLEVSRAVSPSSSYEARVEVDVGLLLPGATWKVVNFRWDNIPAVFEEVRKRLGREAPEVTLCLKGPEGEFMVRRLAKGALVKLWERFRKGRQ